MRRAKKMATREEPVISITRFIVISKDAWLDCSGLYVYTVCITVSTFLH